MLTKKVQIPTLNDGLNDFLALFRLWNDIFQSHLPVSLDFSSCRFLRHNAVAFLGGLIRYAELQGNHLRILWNTMSHDVLRNLKKNRFAYYFHPDDPFAELPLDSGNAIPYREDQTENSDEIVWYLSNDWLGKDWIQLSEELKSHIVGTIWEIYTNAFEHSQSKIGITSCGQHFPNLKQLKLSVIDFGAGIPRTVKTYLNRDIPSTEAMKWAFEKGTSTKSEITSMARGLGLDLLKEFIKLNRGRLEVFSNDVYVLIDSYREMHQTLPVSFHGTLVNISLICDERIYYLSSS